MAKLLIAIKFDLNQIKLTYIFSMAKLLIAIKFDLIQIKLTYIFFDGQAFDCNQI